MKIAGMQKLSLVDYPEKMCCTLFTSGCNLRCPFCHNSGLVVRPVDEFIPLDEVFDYLKKRKGMLQAVTISGGEPLLQKGVEDFAKQVKDLGYLVKLDTNGTMPQKLKQMVLGSVVDYVAMDIKNSLEKYPITCGLDEMDLEGIKESVSFLLEGHVDFEFRTTVTRTHHSVDDFKRIAAWLGDTPKYFLQQFVNSGDLIDDSVVGYDNDEMQNVLAEVAKLMPKTKLRGV